MLKKLLCFLLLCLALTSAAMAEDEITIVVATDTHYLSPSLTDYGEGFMDMIKAADGKVTHYTPQIMQAFVAQMLQQMPDAIILSGDLTLNGAPQSHQDLIALLRPLKDAGIRVLALPGNHDTGYAAYLFAEDYAEVIEGTANDLFDDLYADYGYADAIARDEHSPSYVAELSPDLWCLMLDTYANGSYGTVKEKTLAWIEEQLQLAQERNVTVISATHNNLLQHSPLFSFGYIINNNSKLLDLYDAYDVKLNLSGHIHLQHILQERGVTEIVTSSMAVAPNQYGVLTVRGASLEEYETQQVDVAAWAQEAAPDQPDLLDFARYSRDFFDNTTAGQLQQTLAELPASDDEKARMEALSVALNAGYFAGRHAMAYNPADLALWEKYVPEGFYIAYLRSMWNEREEDWTKFTFGE